MWSVKPKICNGDLKLYAKVQMFTCVKLTTKAQTFN